jgi:uncharacterized membrane protein (DUF4010 family)
MFVRIAALLLLLAPPLGLQLLAPLAAAALVLLLAGLWRWRQRGPASAEAAGDVPPFELATALGFGLYLALVTVIVDLARARLGTTGLVGSGLVAGLADLDAVTISLAHAFTSGKAAAGAAVLSIGAALLSNMVVKAVMAHSAGGAAFGRATAIGYAAAALVALATAGAMG